jgi:hypothetical protein
MGTFGRIEIEVPRARLNGAGRKTTEWNSQVLRAYQRRTLAADALIASTYLTGTNTRRVRRALKALFGGAVGHKAVGWQGVGAPANTPAEIIDKLNKATRISKSATFVNRVDNQIGI